LYNDIIPISVVSDEHRMLRGFLSQIAEVHEVTDLLVDALGSPAERERLIREVCRQPGGERRVQELLERAPHQLVASLVAGTPARHETLTDALLAREYDLPPLPNLYFMRDSSFVVRDRIAIGAMAHTVRLTEAMLLRAIVRSSAASVSGLSGTGVVFDGCDRRLQSGADVRVEGGDVLVARRDLLVVGISERTSTEAIDSLSRELLAVYQEPVTVIAVVLPRERSTIHLDMIFTLVDANVALVYEPYVTGSRRVDAYRMKLAPGVPARIEKCDGLLTALELEGVSLTSVPCGGRNPVVREREQWLSAANVFAFAPGKVIGYDCNVATMDAFSDAGFAVRPVQEYLDGERSVDDDSRLFVGMPGINLARGGGGPRCMTLPVCRDPL